MWHKGTLFDFPVLFTPQKTESCAGADTDPTNGGCDSQCGSLPHYDRRYKGCYTQAFAAARSDGIEAWHCRAPAKGADAAGAPVVVSSLAGDGYQFWTTGGASPYSVSASSFRVYVAYKVPGGGAAPADMPAFANEQNWHVNWLAMVVDAVDDLSPCAGQTTDDSANWTPYAGAGPGNGISTNVDMTGCGLTSAPVVLSGLSNAWTATGGSAPYEATSTGFEMYVRSAGISPVLASQSKWHANWLATEVVRAAPSAPPLSCASPMAGYDAKSGQRVTNNAVRTGATQQDCCAACDAEAQCTAWAFAPDKAGENCWLLASTGGYTPAANRVVGFSARAGPQLHPVGDPALCTGQTSGRHTNWVRDENSGRNGIYVDINIGSCGFTSLPVVVTSLAGNGFVWTAKGGSEPYFITRSSFRVVVYYEGTPLDPGITVAMANEWSWHVNWMATEEVVRGSSGSQATLVGAGACWDRSGEQCAAHKSLNEADARPQTCLAACTREYGANCAGFETRAAPPSSCVVYTTGGDATTAVVTTRNCAVNGGLPNCDNSASASCFRVSFPPAPPPAGTAIASDRAGSKRMGGKNRRSRNQRTQVSK